MKFVVSSAILNSRLQILDKVVVGKNVSPLDDCFLFEIRDGQMNVTATDRENVMRSSIVLEESEGDGSFAVQHRTILDAVKELDEQPLLFEVDTETYSMEVTYVNGKYKFAGMDPEGFMEAPEVGDGATVVTLPAVTLSDTISRTLFAVGQDPIRQVMNGIYFDITPECLAIVSSDGHKLVRNRIDSLGSDTPASFILPKKPAAMLKNVLAKDGGDAVVKFNKSIAEITFDGGSLICRLIEGAYPKYNSVIPEANPNRILVDRVSMIGALRRVLPFASQSTHLVRLHMETGRVVVSSEDVDFAASAREEVLCDYDGQTMDIGFKGTALLDILTVMDGREVVIQLADPSRAGTIVPAVQQEGGDVLMLLMPMLLNDY